MFELHWAQWNLSVITFGMKKKTKKEVHKLNWWRGKKRCIACKHVWMKCIAKFESKWMNAIFQYIQHDTTTFKMVLFIIHSSVCTILQLWKRKKNIFVINFLLNFGVLNSLTLSSENMSRNGEINMYMWCKYYIHIHTYAASFFSLHIKCKLIFANIDIGHYNS